MYKYFFWVPILVVAINNAATACEADDDIEIIENFTFDKKAFEENFKKSLIKATQKENFDKNLREAVKTETLFVFFTEDKFGDYVIEIVSILKENAYKNRKILRLLESLAEYDSELFQMVTDKIDEMVLLESIRASTCELIVKKSGYLKEESFVPTTFDEKNFFLYLMSLLIIENDEGEALDAMQKLYWRWVELGKINLFSSYVVEAYEILIKFGAHKGKEELLKLYFSKFVNNSANNQLSLNKNPKKIVIKTRIFYRLLKYLDGADEFGLKTLQKIADLQSTGLIGYHEALKSAYDSIKDLKLVFESDEETKLMTAGTALKKLFTNAGLALD